MAMGARRSASYAQVAPNVLRWSQWLLAQGKANRDDSDAVGLTKAELAKRLGVSPRAVSHWLAPKGSPDYRAIPIDALAKLQRWQDEKLSKLRRRRALLDVAEDVDLYRPRTMVIPLRQQRYEKAQRLGDQYYRSEIFTVDVVGLTMGEIENVLRLYFRQLKYDGRNWMVRFLALINVNDYFKGGVRDSDVARSIHGRRSMPIWIPPYGDKEHKQFIYPNAMEESVIASQMEMLTETSGSAGKYQNLYGDRIKQVLKISFAPFRLPAKKESASAVKRKKVTGK